MTFKTGHDRGIVDAIKCLREVCGSNRCRFLRVVRSDVDTLAGREVPATAQHYGAITACVPLGWFASSVSSHAARL
jgi:hypothetical protein